MELSAYGTKGLRDAFVVVLALSISAPIWWTWPVPSTLVLGGYLGLFATPFPRWILRRLAGAEGGQASTVIVLAGGFARGATLSERSKRRLHHALWLLGPETSGSLLLCGGALGKGPDGTEVTEAEALRQEALEAGFLGTILVEDRSRTTLENLLALRRLVKTPCVLITCPQHVPRVRRLLEQTAPPETPSPPILVKGYPVEQLPRGILATMELAAECFYEIAIHVWLALRKVLCKMGLVKPLYALRRTHL